MFLGGANNEQLTFRENAKKGNPKKRRMEAKFG